MQNKSVSCIEWALDTLQRLGYSIQNSTPETILQTPWSSVYRFITQQGYCYLKKVPAALSRESQVIDLLQKACAAPVPTLIANSPQEHCFLMQDAGIPLREFFKQGFDAELFIKIIHDYIAVQHKSITYLPDFLNLGVSDWRLTKIPELYLELIQQEELLRADGLTNAELKQLSQLTPKLMGLCEQLSGYAIPDTFNHSDFHDNNILIDLKTRQITLIDLGEVDITHPFFSLSNILHWIKKNGALEKDAYQDLQQQALQPWLDYAPHDHLLNVMSLIQQHWSIHAVLVEYRLLTSVDSLHQLLGKGRLARQLRMWLTQAMSQFDS
jgi:Phosphotransferase enzyme family